MSDQWLYGLHPVISLLERTPERILELFVATERSDQRMQQVLQLAGALGLLIQRRSRAQLDHLASDQAHQGVVARVRAEEPGNEHDLLQRLPEWGKQPVLLLLDGVTDPHNLGACLRSADAAGVSAVVVPKDRATGITPVVRKVAAGAAEWVPFFQVTNLARVMRQLSEAGVYLIGLARSETAVNFYESTTTQASKVQGAVGVVLGAEGTGLRRLTKEHCDVLAFLPMSGYVESLNVSVATGIVLYEIMRHRNSTHSPTYQRSLKPEA